MRPPVDPVAVIEAVYRADVEERAWLDGIVSAAAPLVDDGFGVMSFVYDLSDPAKVGLGTLVGKRVPLPGWATLFRHYSKRTVPSEREPVLFGPPCATLTETVGRRFLETNPLARKVRLVGIRDLMVVHGRDPSRRGCALAVPLGSAGPVREDVASTWARIGAHLAAGLRLRARLAKAPKPDADPLRDAEVILDGDGKVLHAAAAGESREARAVIRGAAIAIDRARGSLRRRSESEAVELWKALVDGRWTIVEHFDRDGRRFVVARPNEPTPARAPESLSQREAQVLGYAALGHSNKYIAYELGLAESTVATHLSHAAKKLGATSRAELLRRFHER